MEAGQTGVGAPAAACSYIAPVLPVVCRRPPASGGPAALSPRLQPGASVPRALNALPSSAPGAPLQHLLGCTPEALTWEGPSTISLGPECSSSRSCVPPSPF